MPKKMIELDVNEDGTLDISQFSSIPELVKTKQLIDGLRGNVEELKGTKAELRKVQAELEAAPTQETISSLESQIQEAKGFAMTDEQKQALEELEAIKAKLSGKPVDEVLAGFEEAAALKAKTAEEEKLASLRSFFESAGINFDVARQLAGITNLEFSSQDSADGASVPIVKAGENWVSLDSYLSQNYAPFMSALKAGEVTPSPQGSGANITGAKQPKDMSFDEAFASDEALSSTS